MDELTGSSVPAINPAQRASPSIGEERALSKLWPCLAAALLGAVVIAGVGFAPGVAHDAAHDVRHTMSFPCH